MKCYCYEADAQFIFCVEDVKGAQLEELILHMAWTKTDGKFLMPYPLNAFANQGEKELISDNFHRLGQSMFDALLSGIAWEKPLEMVAKKFNENGIEWYIVGSVGDALRGLDVQPLDIDLVVRTKDYYKAKDVCYQSFPDSIVAPFTENGSICPLKYFGRMFLAGALVEVAADEVWNLESRRQGFGRFTPPISGYEKASWHGHDIYVESLQLRQQIEIARKRKDRIEAFEKFMRK